jgi:hypothetical protein
LVTKAPASSDKGGQAFDVETERDAFLGGDLYRVRVQDDAMESQVAIVTITLQSNRTKQLQTNATCTVSISVRR